MKKKITIMVLIALMCITSIPNIAGASSVKDFVTVMDLNLKSKADD